MGKLKITGLKYFNLKKKVLLKNFLEPSMFCHLAVLIYLCGEVVKVKDPRYMQNKKDSRISLGSTM
jgi:hypothetical protein